MALRSSGTDAQFLRNMQKGPPNDIYFIIEGPYDGYFTEKVSQAQKSRKPLV